LALQRTRRKRARANRARAAFAEDLVATWYTCHGYHIVARNWRCKRGELDVVAWRDNTLVVCEVKARRNANLGDPFESITPQKIAKLRRATAMFVDALSKGAPPVSGGGLRRPIRNIRFDAAAVLGGHVEVREAAF
jgi:putative endonuclease